MDKNELLAAISDSYSKLSEQIGKMTDDELSATSQFALDCHSLFAPRKPRLLAQKLAPY